MLLKRLSGMCDLDQSELKTLLQIKHAAPARMQKHIPRKQPISPYHWLILLLLFNPGYYHALDQKLVMRSDDINEELALLKFLVEFLNTRPDIVNSASTVSVLTYFQDSPHKALLEKIESEILDLDDKMDLEAEFSGALKKLQEMQRKKRMSELHNKPLSLLTDDEKRELKRLATY